jgi:hypothetical protein
MKARNSASNFLPWEDHLSLNPIHKVLSTMAAHQVRVLLMGGQACVLYGAAEFSRDTDLLILAEVDNLGRLSAALDELQAVLIAVPPFDIEFLKRGFAVHFRCHHPDAAEMRVDLMSVLRGVEDFASLWSRRTTLAEMDGATYELISVQDLVRSKKTQRDKDWPMLRRLVEIDYLRNRSQPDDPHVRFWLLELRTPELLVEAAKNHPVAAQKFLLERPLLQFACKNESGELEAALIAEEKLEREKDRAYWKPLREELERLRHGKKL